jgi:hypothetical protein
MDESKPLPKSRDIAIVSGPTEDGQGARILRIREGELSAGEIRPVKEGESIAHAEVVRLRPTDAHPRICEVEVLHAPAKQAKTEQAKTKQAEPERPRRARVATDSYRKNWDAIFDGKKKKKSWSVN